MELDRFGTRLFSGIPLASTEGWEAPTPFVESWGDAENDFPRHFKRQLARWGWKDLVFLVGFPDYRAPIPGGEARLDLLALAQRGEKRVVMAILASAPQPATRPPRDLFGTPVEDKHLPAAIAALLEADRFGATEALLLVHSFGEAPAWKQQFQAFSQAIGAQGEPAVRPFGPFRLCLGWIEAGPDYQ